MKLQNKTIIITGSSTGIGSAIATLFATEGANVVINSKSNMIEGERLAKELSNKGGKAIYVQADVSDEKGVDILFEKTISTFGSLDILVNNAGKTIGQPFLESSREHWLEQFQSNFFCTVFCSQKAAKIMKEQGGGKILNTTSIRGIDYAGREGIMAYSAAKAALINFTKTLAKDLAPNIQVNAIAPGFVLTRNYDNTPEEVKQGFLNSTYLKKWITPEQIAQAFLFLATDEAITGQVITVDGGFTLK